MTISVATTGRILLLGAFAAMGAQHIIAVLTHMPVSPPWGPVGETRIALAIGVLLLGTSATALLASRGRDAAMVLLLMFVCVARIAIVYLPGIIAHPRDPTGWTVALELLALAGGLLVLATTRPRTERWSPAVGRVGTWMVALSLAGFGMQHFLYAKFVGALVPAWMPWHLFWAWAVGVGFVAAAVAFVTRIQARLAGICLGAMFCSWLLLLHGPLVVNALHNGDEWMSLLVAAAMAGVGFVVAGYADDHAHRRDFITSAPGIS